MKWKEANRRKVLKIIGTGVVGSAVMAGRAAADEGVEDTTDIELEGGDDVSEDHAFDPPTYTANARTDETVQWEHDDQSFGGMVHNVHIEENPRGGTQLMSSGALEDGDTYAVTFSLEGANNDTLRLKEEDGNQSKTIDVSDESNSVKLGVHCDFHGGQIGQMTMESFKVLI